jgi:glycosyltransferase involved in cell wall biosynthesis
MSTLTVSSLAVMNLRPKILIAALDSYPPFRVDVVCLFSKYLTPHLCIDWVMARENVGAGEIVHRQKERFYVARNGGLAGSLDMARLHLFALSRVLRGHYDVVQCRDRIFVSVLYALASCMRGAPFVYWMSFPMEEGYLYTARQFAERGKFLQALPRWLLGHLGHFLLYRFTLRFACHVFVQSDYMKNSVAQQSIPVEKLTAVPMGVDVEAFNAESVTPAIGQFYDGKRVVLYTGTLHQGRQMDTPLAGLAQAMERTPDAVFVAIGGSTDEERAAVRRTMASVIERVLFLDHMPLNEMLRHVRRADVCLAPFPVTPIFLVGTPTKLPEYLAMGRRVVANHHPDQTRIIQQVRCCVPADFNADSFREAILRALELGPPTPEESAQALQWVRLQRDYRTMSRMVMGVYEKLTAPERGVTVRGC